MYCSPLGSMELRTILRKEGSPRLVLGLWDPQATSSSYNSSSTSDKGDSHAVPPSLNMAAGSESWPEALPLCSYNPVLTGVPAWHTAVPEEPSSLLMLFSSFNILNFCFVCLCLCLRVGQVPQCLWRAEGQLEGVDSLLPSRRSQELNSVGQSWQQAPLPTVTSPALPCLSVRLFVCLFVCVFVCLRQGIR